MSYFKEVDLWLKSVGNGTPEEVAEQQKRLRRQFERDMAEREAARQATLRAIEQRRTALNGKSEAVQTSQQRSDR
jgi:hypothetical protein